MEKLKKKVNNENNFRSFRSFEKGTFQHLGAIRKKAKNLYFCCSCSIDSQWNGDDWNRKEQIKSRVWPGPRATLLEAISYIYVIRKDDFV